MNILMVTPGRLPVPAVKGGAVESLIDMLIEYNEKYLHYELHVVSLWDDAAEEKSKEYQYTSFTFLNMGKLFDFAMKRHLLPYRWLDCLFSKKAVGILKKKQQSYDSIVIQNETVNGTVFQKQMDGTYIYHAHNDLMDSIQPKELTFLKSCKKVIGISRFLSEKIEKEHGLSNLTTVYNGIDTHFFHGKKYKEKRWELRKQYGIDEKDIVVVFSGRMVAEKGVKELLQSFLLLPKQLSMKILIIGSSFFGADQENAYLKELKDLCQRRQKDIIFTGYVKYEKMPEYYAMADIGCVPSIWEEPFGLTVVEQMAMGLPMVVTDSGAIPEIVDETCGYMIKRDAQLCENLAAAMHSLYENKTLRTQMGERGRAVVCSRFSKEEYCRKWFETVIGYEQTDFEYHCANL